jgi:hypothetical protein
VVFACADHTLPGDGLVLESTIVRHIESSAVVPGDAANQ